MEKQDHSEMFDIFAEDLLAERSARPLVIIGASKVDHLLLEILRSLLLPKRNKVNDQDELLEGDSPIGTFSARIKLCRRLGLVDETLFIALERLRGLRNLSAHAISFDDSKSPVREHLSELRRQITNRQSYSLTKRRYFDAEPLQAVEQLQCLLLTLCVLLEAIRERVKPIVVNRSAVTIAAK
jgi:hypothetical protein